MVTLDEHGLLMQQKLPLWLLLLQTPWCQENHPPDGHHHYDYGIDDDDVDQWIIDHYDNDEVDIIILYHLNCFVDMLVDFSHSVQKLRL